MSAETAALVRYMVDSGVPHRVTSVVRPGAVTAAGYPSRHAVGLAVDFAGVRGGRDTDELAAIFNALAKVHTQLHELIYAGPQVSANVKAGRWVPKYAQAGHHDHVHVSVDRGVIVRWVGPPAHAKEEEAAVAAPPPDNPDIQNVYSDVAGIAGTPTGRGYWIVTKDGAVYTFGDAEYFGGVEVIRQ